MTATALRTPGVTFTVVPPAIPQTLPRMDIAGFVGFAASGPIDTPVPVTDPGTYADVFGDDLFLARDEAAGVDVYCNLGPAVRAFFAGGGRRCWVVRVARGARTAVVPVPGLASRNADGTLTPAQLAARSAGTWADGLLVSAALTSQAVTVASASLSTDPPSLVLSGPSDLAAGDLIRLTVGSESDAAPAVGPQMAMMVISAGSVAGARAPAGMQVAAVDPTSVLYVRDVVEGAEPLPAAGSEGSATVPSCSPASFGATFTGVSGDAVTVSLAGAAGAVAPLPGQFVIVQDLLGHGGEDLWLAVEDVHVDPFDRGALVVQGTAQFVAADPGVPGAFDSPPAYAERLTFDLLAQAPDDSLMQVGSLGFSQSHPRWVGLLPSDEQLFDPGPCEAVGQHDPAWGAIASLELWTESSTPDLWTGLTSPRFPCAAAIGDGLPLVGSLSYPLAMPVFESHWLSPPPDSDVQLVREGLASFDSRLFVDDRLRGDLATDVQDDADTVAFTGPEPAPLQGVHALLYNDEVTLIAVPDATQRGWDYAKSVSEPLDVRFAALVGPAEGGVFVECGTRVLTPPTLAQPTGVVQPLGSPPVGVANTVFMLSWTPSVAADAQYLLQQSVDPGFDTATTYYEGPATSVTVYSLSAGVEAGAGAYFRVRVIAGTSQSNWSNAVQIVAGPPLRAFQIPVDLYESDTLIDVHRALLRAAAARGDMLAVLALPSHYTEGPTLAHLGQLQTAVVAAPEADPPLFAVPPLAVDEASAYSFGALYHPWTVVVETDGTLTPIPPDGPAVAVLAARSAIARGALFSTSGGIPRAPAGAWLSPGNVPLTAVVSLTPTLDPTLLSPGAVAGINVLSQTAIGFVSLSAWTLSNDPNLQEVSVRRLLSLLRRMAMLLGPRYVFEPNGRLLVHAVTRDFDSLLADLFSRGAFAGATPATSYFLNVESGADPTTGLDRAQLSVQIGVAPSEPLKFLTVQLTQEAGGATQVGGS